MWTWRKIHPCTHIYKAYNQKIIFLTIPERQRRSYIFYKPSIVKFGVFFILPYLTLLRRSKVVFSFQYPVLRRGFHLSPRLCLWVPNSSRFRRLRFSSFLGVSGSESPPPAPLSRCEMHKMGVLGVV